MKCSKLMVEEVMKNKFSILLLILIWISSASAYEDKITHPDLTKKAIAASNLESYLISNFGKGNLGTLFLINHCA